jgi:hypothetical protein
MNLEAKQYDEQIKSKKSSFLPALDEFKKYYVYYNKNPEVDDYNTHFLHAKEQLQTLSSSVFEITNAIQRKIDEKNKIISGIAGKLNTERELSTKLENIINSLNGVKAGSSVMIDDSKTEYKFQFYRNTELFIGIVALLALLVSTLAAAAVLIGFIIRYNTGIAQAFVPILGFFF